MSQGREGKGERSFEVQTMISVQNHLEKTKSCTAINLAWDRAPQFGEKLKREKIGELSGSLAGLGKRVHVIFLCPSTPYFPIFFPQRSPVRVRSALINNSCAAGSQQTSLP